MNEETIKELLSVNFIRILAERAGFVVTRFQTDYGDDLMVNKVVRAKSATGFNYFTSGEQIGIQLKCTTQKGIVEKEELIKYRLKGKSFRHLSARMNNWNRKNYVPLFLILVIIPEEEDKWLELDLEGGKLTINSKAYWYLPSEKETIPLRKSTTTISISKENQVNLNTVNQLFQLFSNRDVA